ncbi:MAG: long-chain fatty acid--CoA ligase [Acidimicrobiales bacterium]
MKTVSGAALAPVPREAHLLQGLLERERREPEAKLASYREGERFVDLTVRDVVSRIRAVARGLIASGVQPGDRVALMSHTRLEWLIVDHGILAAGAVTVPVYDTSSVEQIRWILSNSGAVLMIAETPGMAAEAETVRESTPACTEVLVIDEGGLDELERRGATVADAEVDARIATLGSSSIATIIYTSGTTGMPKGCVLTHGNLCANVAQTNEALGSEVRPGDSGLLFLPLAHAMTKGNALFALASGIRVAFATDIAKLPHELKLARPTTIVAVPRIFEKVFNTAHHHAAHGGKAAIFDRATATAIRWSKASTGGRVGPLLRIEHAVFDKVVYAKVRAAFGGRLRMAFSGGGPLGERLTHFFHGVGVRIYEGYGLTETSPTLTVNRPGAWRPGTVGRPIAGTSIAIADDGEILAKGPQVFAGYWHDDAATAEVFDVDGWFHTGDIGELDEQGYLRITGRKKDLIVTAAGKNVAPAPLEDRIRAHELISQAVVIGDARPFVAALVTIDASAFADWANEHGCADEPFESVRTSAELRSAVQAAIDQANASVSRAESIRAFTILAHDLSIESGELTPTLKVRRAVVEQRHAAEIEHLYAGRPPDAEATTVGASRH